MIERLRKHWPNLAVTIEQIHTTGDQSQRSNVPLARIGGDGVFVTEIERALSERRIDLAVHSLKDLPTTQPDGLRVVVMGPREDVRDILISNMPFEVTPQGLRSSNPDLERAPRIGTCSLRRMAQIRALCPGSDILPLRGNVDTRLRKLVAGDYDGIILAAAGVHRLHMHQQLLDRCTYFPIDLMLPAPGQGALGLEIRDEPEVRALIAPLKSMETQAETAAERMFMRRLGAGCYLPVAAYGRIEQGLLTLRGLVISADGQRQVRVQQELSWAPGQGIEWAEQLGVKLAEEALALGADEIIQEVSAVRVQEPDHV